MNSISRTQYWAMAADGSISCVPAFVLNVTTAEGQGVALLDPSSVQFRVDANGKWATTGDHVLLDCMLDLNLPVMA